MPKVKTKNKKRGTKKSQKAAVRKKGTEEKKPEELQQAITTSATTKLKKRQISNSRKVPQKAKQVLLKKKPGRKPKKALTVRKKRSAVNKNAITQLKVKQLTNKGKREVPGTLNNKSTEWKTASNANSEKIKLPLVSQIVKKPTMPQNQNSNTVDSCPGSAGETFNASAITDVHNENVNALTIPSNISVSSCENNSCIVKIPLSKLPRCLLAKINKIQEELGHSPIENLVRSGYLSNMKKNKKPLFFPCQMQIFQKSDQSSISTVDTTIEEVIQKYSISESTEKDVETVEEVRESLPSDCVLEDEQLSTGGSDVALKSFSVNLENVFFNKDLVQKYNLLKNQKNSRKTWERKSKKRKIMYSGDPQSDDLLHAESLNSPTPSDFSLASVPEDEEFQNGSYCFVPEASRNTPVDLQESQNECSDRGTLHSPIYSDTSNFSTNLSARPVQSEVVQRAPSSQIELPNKFGSIINIRITRNVGASKAQITCVPLAIAAESSSCYDRHDVDESVQSSSDYRDIRQDVDESVQSSPDYHAVELSQDFESYNEQLNFETDCEDEDYGPTMIHYWHKSVFSLEYVQKVLSVDEIFENATLSTLDNVMEILSLPERKTEVSPQTSPDKRMRASPDSSNTLNRNLEMKFSFINDRIKTNIQPDESSQTSKSMNSYNGSPQSTNSSGNSSLLFRKPMCPPVMRPPSKAKLKRTLTNSTNFAKTKREENEDVLSVCNSSTSWLDNLEKSLSVGVKSSTDFEQELETTDDIYSNESSSASSFLEKDRLGGIICAAQKSFTEEGSSFTGRDSIERIPQIEGVNPSSIQRDLAERISKSDSIERIFQSEGVSGSARRDPTEMISHSDSEVRRHGLHFIPPIFRGLCYAYYTESCRRSNCIYRHYVSEDVKFNISNLSAIDLGIAYDFAKTRYKLFMATFPAFAENFSKIHSTQELLASVNIVMRLGLNDKTPFIKRILSCLCDIGIPLIDAVEEIFQCGDSQLSISLADILLDIICISEKKQSLLANWCIVQSLIKHRKEPLDNELVIVVIQYCCDSKNVELAQHIIKDIVSASLVNLEAFETEILMKFLDLVKDCPEETLLREKMPYTKLPLLPRHISNENGHWSSPSDYSVNDKNHLPLSDFKWQKVPTALFSSQGSSNRSISSSSSATHIFNYVNNSISDNFNGNTSNNSHVPTHKSIDSLATVSNKHLLPNYDLVKSTSSPCVSNKDALGEYDDRSFTSSTDIPTCDEVLPEPELIHLKKIIDCNNVLEFFIMFTKYRPTPLSHVFLLNTLAYMKTKKPGDIHNMICQLIDGIANIRPNEDILESLSLLVANVLGILECYGAYKMAGQILLKYEGKFKKLTDLTWYSGPHRNVYSEMGKYIYFCKILVKGDYLKQAWSVLTSSELKLLQPLELCQFSCNRAFDSKFRDHVVDDLVGRALMSDQLFAKELILHLINCFTHTEFVNIWSYFSTLILNLMENPGFKQELKRLLKPINNLWYKNVNASVLRKLLISTVNDCTDSVLDRDILTLYQKLCIKRCYVYVKGDEEKLSFQSDITDAEVYASLCFYLYRKIKNRYPTTNLELSIKFTNRQVQHPSCLTANVAGIKQRILRILSCSFPFSIIGYSHSHRNSVIINEKHLEPVINFYRKMFVSRE